MGKRGKFWLVVFLLGVLVVGVVTFIFFQRRLSQLEPSSVTIEGLQENAPEKTKQDSGFLVRGEPVPVGVEVLGNSRMRVVGQFESDIYEENGLYKAQITAGESKFVLVLGISSGRIPVFSVVDGEIAPGSKRIEGKLPVELGAMTGKPFVATLLVPVKGISLPIEKNDEMITSQSELVHKYFIDNWDTIKSALEAYLNTGNLTGEIGFNTELDISL